MSKVRDSISRATRRWRPPVRRVLGELFGRSLARIAAAARSTSYSTRTNSTLDVGECEIDRRRSRLANRRPSAGRRCRCSRSGCRPRRDATACACGRTRSRRRPRARELRHLRAERIGPILGPVDRVERRLAVHEGERRAGERDRRAGEGRCGTGERRGTLSSRPSRCARVHSYDRCDSSSCRDPRTGSRSACSRSPRSSRSCPRRPRSAARADARRSRSATARSRRGRRGDRSRRHARRSMSASTASSAGRFA